MRRFSAAPWGRVGAVASVLLVAALARPVAADEGPLANSKNQNLTATAKYSASTEYQSDQGNVDFIAAKAFDGLLATRWNADGTDASGSWLAATWDAPVTINKVVIYERFSRVQAYTIQQLDDSGNWVDAYKAQDATYDSTITSRANGDLTFVVRPDKPLVTKGLKVVFDTATAIPSIAEIEAWDKPTATLTGTVTDMSGKPIQGATVSTGLDNALTDANGKYTLLADEGKFNIVAGKSGSYRNRVARGIVLAANAPAAYDFVLLPAPPNLSLTATAVSSSDYQGGTDYNAAKANDGNPSTRWNSDGGDTDGAYLEMQWAQPQTFDKVVIREAIDRIRNYSLQTYDETNATYVDIPGANNVDVPSPASSGNPVFTHIFATPLTSKRLRLLVNHADNLPSIWELEVSNPSLGTVSGVVTDAATGKPVANATLTSDLGVTLGTTDANGAFSLLLDADDYVVTPSANGYFAGAPVSFTLNGGDKQQITLTLPPTGPNIALTAAASASTEDPAWPATNVNDGDPTTYWLATDTTNQWVALTWKQPTTFTAVQLRNYLADRTDYPHQQASSLQMLDKDGKTWVDLPGAQFAPQFTQPDTLFFPGGVTTTSVRFFISATDSATLAPGLGEILVFNTPIPATAP